jgi:hypothetical protein
MAFVITTERDRFLSLRSSYLYGCTWNRASRPSLDLSRLWCGGLQAGDRGGDVTGPRPSFGEPEPGRQ